MIENAFTSLAASAMRNSVCLEIEYHGKVRVIETHAIGMSSKNNPVIRAFQLSERTMDGADFKHTEEWKLFKIEEITDFKAIGINSLAPRPGFKPNDAGMGEIFAEVTHNGSPP